MHFHNQLLWRTVADIDAHVAHKLELGRVRACDREQCVDQMVLGIELSLFCYHYRATRHHMTVAGRVAHL